MQLSDLLELAVREGVRRRIEKRAGVVLPLAVGAMIPGIVDKALERAHSTERTLDRSAYNPMKMAASFNPRTSPFQDLLSRFGGLLGQGGAAVGRGAASAGRTVGQGMLGSGGDSDKPSGFQGSFGELGASPVAGLAKGISGGIGRRVDKMFGGQEFGEKKDPFHMGAGAAIQTFGKEMGTTGANLLRDMANKAMEAAGQAGDSSAREAILGDLKRTDPVLANADDKTLMEAYHTMTRFAPVLSTDKNAVRSFLRQAVMSGAGPDFMSIKLLADSERAVTGGNDKHAGVPSGLLAAEENLGKAYDPIRQALLEMPAGRASSALETASGPLAARRYALQNRMYAHDAGKDLAAELARGRVSPEMRADAIENSRHVRGLARHTLGGTGTAVTPEFPYDPQGIDKRAASPAALEGLLPSLGRGALMGGGVGAVSGALADKDDHVGGALRGAMGGAAMGGLGGALHGHMSTPKATPNQGSLSHGQGPNRNLGGANIGTPSMGLPSSGLSRHWDPGETPRWVPQGAEDALGELSHRNILEDLPPKTNPWLEQEAKKRGIV